MLYFKELIGKILSLAVLPKILSLTTWLLAALRSLEYPPFFPLSE